MPETPTYKTRCPENKNRDPFADRSNEINNYNKFKQKVAKLLDLMMVGFWIYTVEARVHLMIQWTVMTKAIRNSKAVCSTQWSLVIGI